MATSDFLPGLFMITDCANRLPAKKAQVMATVRRDNPSPGLRPPSPRFAGRGALDIERLAGLEALTIERPSPRLRGEGAAKRRMRGKQLLLIRSPRASSR